MYAVVPHLVTAKLLGDASRGDSPINPREMLAVIAGREPRRPELMSCRPVLPSPRRAVSWAMDFLLVR